MALPKRTSGSEIGEQYTLMDFDREFVNWVYKLDPSSLTAEEIDAANARIDAYEEKEKEEEKKAEEEKTEPEKTESQIPQPDPVKASEEIKEKYELPWYQR